MTFAFSSKFIFQQIVFSNMRFEVNNLRSAFSEMKLVKLKSFTFSKPKVINACPLTGESKQLLTI